MEQKIKLTGLESLRGIAALVVALHHVGWANFTYDLGLVRHATLMVDFFFVLSGFVICFAYGDRLQDFISLKRFMFLRFWRLWPLHIAMLLVMLVIEIAKYIAEVNFGLVANHPAFEDSGFGAFVANVLLVHSLGLLDHGGFNAVSWSISTEFYAYLVFSIVAFSSPTRSMRLAISFTFIVVCGWILFHFNESSLTPRVYTYGFFRCLLGFFFGVIAYHIYDVLYRLRTDIIHTGLYDAFSWLIFLTVGVLVWLIEVGPLQFLLPAFFGCLVVTVALSENSGVARFLNISGLIWLGKVSYSVYMVHLAVNWTIVQILRFTVAPPMAPDMKGRMILELPDVYGAILLLVYVGAVLFASYVAFHWIEDPFRKWSKQKVKTLFLENRKHINEPSAK